MSKAAIQLVYEGPALENHMMDVQELAPALLSFGDLCKEANCFFNKDKAYVKVSIKSEFERGSFLINYEVTQGLYALTGLFKDPRVMTAKEILEWLGIILTLSGGFGLFKYLKARRGRKIESKEYTEIDKKQNTVQIKFEGDNNIVCVPQQVYELGENKKILQACKGIMNPLQTPGIDFLKFKDIKSVHETIDKKEAGAIISSELLEGETLEPQVIEARLEVHTVTFDIKQSKWKFKYGDNVISVDVSETDIPKKAIERGYVNIGDTYKVKLEIIERQTEAGNYVNDYKIVEVLAFFPGPTQQRLL